MKDIKGTHPAYVTPLMVVNLETDIILLVKNMT